MKIFKLIFLVAVFIVLLSFSFELYARSDNKGNSFQLQDNFVYLYNIDSSILQDIRYASSHNFIGRPIVGYYSPTCILTKPAAIALAHVQKDLKKISPHLSLKVYDCYRPQMAVDDFVNWSHNVQDQKMKPEFYPHVEKTDLFKLGYIASQSGHTRGSTVDLTINGKNMGTHFDYMDKSSHNDYRFINTEAYKNRMLLKHLMQKNGFVSYAPEWWHFTLKSEPYPSTYFNFPVQ